MTELEHKLMESLEELNLRYIKLQNSKEMRVGKNLIAIKKAISSGKFSKILLILKKRYGQKIIDKRYPGKIPGDNLNPESRAQNITHIDSNARVAVYTCIVGGYDQLSDPIYTNDGYDFFVFSDKKVDSVIWKNREIPDDVKKLNDQTLINRYLKMHPAEVFPKYDYAVYVDGNVCITSDISALIRVANEGKTGFAMHRHVLRDCIYDEAEACILYGKGNTEKLRQQVERYKHEGFPTKYGMLEATVIIFNIHSKECKMLMSDWWNEFIKSGSKRDQIALPYILWKKGYKILDVGYLGSNVYKNPKFQVLPH